MSSPPLKQVRRIAGILFVVGLCYVIWLLTRVQRPGQVELQRPAPPQGVKPPPDAELGCADNTVLDWDGRRLEAQRACKEPDGSLSLVEPILHLDRRSETGELVVKGRVGRLPADPSEPVRLQGGFELTTPEGLELKGTSLELNKAQKRVRCTEPVTFRQHDLTGKAGHLEHDWEAKETWLTESPEVVVEGNRSGGRRVIVRGKLIRFREAARHVIVHEAGTIDFADGQIAGNDLDVTLAAESDEVERIEATGAARTITTATVPGGAGANVPMRRTLSADHVVHDLPGGALRTIEADGGVTLSGEAMGAPQDAAPRPSENLKSDWLRLAFAGGDGAGPARLQSLAARGNPASFAREDALSRDDVHGREIGAEMAPGGFVKRLSAGGDARLERVEGPSRRRLSATHAELAFRDAGDHGIESITFQGAPGRLAEEGSAEDPALKRTIVAQEGSLRFDEAGMAVAGKLSEDVEIREGDATAAAREAVLDEATGRTTLTGEASVERAGRKSFGDEIVRDRKAGTLTVKGKQHTIVRDASTVPGMQGEAGDQTPVYISSDELRVDERTREAVYSGGRPSMQRGDNELMADTLKMDDDDGTLDANGNVESKLRLAAAGTAPGAERPGPFDPTRLVVGHSDALRYRRKDDAVFYDGNVTMTQEPSALSASTVEIHLKPGGSEVETLIARGAAIYRGAQGKAEGETIEYHAADKSMRIEGGRRPARAVDPDGRFATGGVVQLKDGSVQVLSPTKGLTRGTAPAPRPGPATP